MAQRKQGRTKGATDHRTRQRIDLVFRMLVARRSEEEIFQFNREGTTKNAAWDMSEDTVYDYIKAAKQKIASLSEAEHPALLGEASATCDMITRDALAKGELRTALAGQAEKSKLFGLYAPPQQPASDDNTAGSVDDLVALIEAAGKQFNGV